MIFQWPNPCGSSSQIQKNDSSRTIDAGVSPPFDITADTARAESIKKVAGGPSSDQCQDQLSVFNTYRNFLFMPTFEGRLVLQAIRSLTFELYLREKGAAPGDPGHEGGTQ